MKKLLSAALCLSLLFCFSACGKKDDKVDTTPTVTTEEKVKAEPVETEEAPVEEEQPAEELSEEETETYVDHETKKEELRSEKEEVEVNNNLTDIVELIDSGEYEDALMLIEAMKTRELSDKEYEILLQLEKQVQEFSEVDAIEE